MANKYEFGINRMSTLEIQCRLEDALEDGGQEHPMFSNADLLAELAKRGAKFELNKNYWMKAARQRTY